MIGHPVLRKIVSANFFFPSAGADLPTALRAVFLSFLALLSLEQTRAQDRHRFLLVLALTPSALTTNDSVRRNVPAMHRGICRLSTLPATTAGDRAFDA